MARLVLIIGGNMGDMEANIERAQALIEQRIGPITERSSVTRSDAWGFQSDKSFLNQVLVVETQMEPMDVLESALDIEKVLGRVREHGAEGYLDRPMDIDILYYNDMTVNNNRLSIPHPLIAIREFVLRPLAEIIPEYLDPRTRKTITQMLRNCLKII